MLRTRFFAAPRVAVESLLFACALLVACASASAAQAAPSAEFREAVRRLNKAAGVREHSAELFEEFVTRYQANWPDAAIADYRARGMFKNLTPEQTAGMEKLIREFSDRVFGEMKRRVVQRLLSDESLEQLTAPVLNRYLTAEEVGQLAAFAESPAGGKLFDVCARKLREAEVASMEARGVFKVLPDPAAEEAKADKILKEGGAGLVGDVLGRLKGWKLSDDFTEGEIRELRAFAATPLGAKLAGTYLNITAEIVDRNARLYAPNAGRIAGEVFNEQMEFFKSRTYEILKGAGGQKRPGGTSVN
jgi:hypothetical protein